MIIYKKKCVFTWSIHLLCVASIFLQSTVCMAWSRGTPAPNPAQVLERNGIPCFTVKNDKKVTFSSITIEERLAKNDEIVDFLWSQFKKNSANSIQLTQNTCLLYGTLLDNQDRFSKPKKLEPGKIYNIYLVTTNQGDYNAAFCLARTEKGSTKVHQINGSFDVCEPLNPTIPPVFHTEIIDKKGVPCFTIKDKEKRTPTLTSLEVYQEQNPNLKEKDEKASVWEILHFGTITLDSSTCLPYGIEIEKSRTSILKPLQKNKIYKVELDVAFEDAWPRISDSKYKGYFCLSRKKNGKTKVHEVPYNEQKKEWDFDVCNKLTEEQNGK
jgi:hypothetical protein